MKRLNRFLVVAMLSVATLVQGCAFMSGAAVGGAAGYELRDEGYHLRSPVTK